MKIAIVNRHRDDALGGSELQCDYIAEELQKRGHEVAYIAPATRLFDHQESYSYQILQCDMAGEAIQDKIQSFEPDIVYWRFNKNFFLKLVRFCRKMDIPFIFAASSVNDVNPAFYKYDRGVRNFVRSLIESYWNHLGFRFVDALTVNNREHLNKLSVRPQLFVPNGMKRDAEPFEWKRPFCVWVSNIKQIKRPESVVDLAKRLENEEFDILMVGQLHDRNYAWLEDPDNLPSNLHYLGAKSPVEVNGLLRAATVHIHTCYPEGFPNVFIQAWIQGTPSVSLGYDPNGYIESKKIGYYSRENEKLFADQVLSLFQNSEVREMMGQNAESFARQLFSIEDSVDKLESLMEELI